MYTQRLIQKYSAEFFKVKTTEMSINFKMDKHEVAYLCNRILFGHKKEVLTQVNTGELDNIMLSETSQTHIV